MVFLQRRKGARALLIDRSCCPQHREGVDVFQPKGWFVNLHDSTVVVVCVCVVSMGFASVPSGDLVSWIPWLVLVHDFLFLLNVFATVLLERPKPDGLE